MLALLCPFVVKAQPGQQPIAILKSVEGSIELRRAGQDDWRLAETDDGFAIGDSIRVQAYSRAVLLLADGTVLRLGQNTTVTFTEPEEEQEGVAQTLLNLIKGVIHVISRNPKNLKITTPFANAGLEGTEFSVEVTDDEAVITVFEGEVSVEGQKLGGRLNAQSGQRVTARGDRQPAMQLLARPQDAVQWTLYYAPVLGYALPAADAEPEAAQSEDPQFFTGRAARRLDVGRVAEAEADIARALTLDAGNVDAIALRAVIALTQNDKPTALALAREAFDREPSSAAASIALSYAQQADFDISAALDTLQNAVMENPQNALAWARLSELYLAVGNVTQALEAAKTAASLDPNLARTQTVLGFAYLSQIEIELAMQTFRKAIELDQAAPLPRLGLGLARIRRGDLVAGRAEIELAVVLDPGNAMLRSYAGKAYYEEKRDNLAESQLEIAKQLDPLDPTPWYYDAIRKQSINRPIEALDDLQASIERNDNRANYRSNLKLDQDLAARSASLGRIYGNLGFEQRALVEGWKSTQTDPSDFSGHRLLADTYSVLPRHQVARVSELLQSQLLQPINVSPIQPQLAESGLFILSGAGPSSIGFNEFNPLFASNGLRAQLNAVTGDDDSDGYDIVVSGIADRYSFSLGRYGYRTDGIRENNDQDRELNNVFVQSQLSTGTSVQFEYRSADSDFGDIGFLFDADNFSPTARTKDDFGLVRIGMHHEIAPGSDLIANVSRVDEDSDFSDSTFDPLFGLGFVSQFEVENRGVTAEVQHIYRRDQLRLISGVGLFDGDRDERTVIDLLLPLPPFVVPFVDLSSDSSVSHENLYFYALIDQSDYLTWTLGLSADDYEEDAFDRDQWNPKLGVSVSLSDDTTIRAAAFRTLTRPLVASQTIEPTQVAGFNQFFDGVVGEEARKYGAAIDHRYTQRLFGGFEYSIRDLTVTAEFPPDVERFDWEERFLRAYLHWAVNARFALAVDYLFEEFDREGVSGPELIFELTTHRLPVSLTYFNPGGWTTRLTSTFIDQEGIFESGVPFRGSDRFAVVDAEISYRLPRRHGSLSLVVKNLTDEEFSFQDTDPANPRALSDRLLLFKLSLSI